MNKDKTRLERLNRKRKQKEKKKKDLHPVRARSNAKTKQEQTYTEIKQTDRQTEQKLITVKFKQTSTWKGMYKETREK
jgi:hypothetical protein